ncbi:uncharacterized protein LOC127241433 isoform X1 [Andrographis paniculata]|uniref:uncharacterized protein LOC127241433 isoform X1 n=1 Tax=Andrographis paniculata TaxID=175694 RepID=UPI0021E909B0|nr:uncharacterized protein LOC127241433 isoform X1 [Andrographis paniculata]
MAEDRRLILRNFLSPDVCKELEFIHKSCCTVGYRPNVFSTTLPLLIATNSAHLIVPLVPIRERLKEKVEEYFGCEYELFVEFTGLISWCKGASIGWHSDDNRDYLKQRDFAVVCYLNSHGVDFNGGLFHFQDGEPSTVVPMAGDAIMYTADNKNIHSVSEISEGERITLSLWFSRDSAHDEDAKILSSLCDHSLNSSISMSPSYFPMLAPHNMYWFPPEEASKFQSGIDICSARLHVLGFDIYSSNEEPCSTMDASNDLKLLNEPLHLARGDKLLSLEFVNILHALQVVQFYYWKAPELKKLYADAASPEPNESSVKVTQLSEVQRGKINSLKGMILKDCNLAENLLAKASKGLQISFDCRSFSAAVAKWEAYTYTLLKEIVTNLPQWRRHGSIFSMVSTD